MKDFLEVEELSEEQILNLYNTIIETNYEDMLSEATGGRCECTCNDNSRFQYMCGYAGRYVSAGDQMSTGGSNCASACNNGHNGPKSLYAIEDSHYLAYYRQPCLCTCGDGYSQSYSCYNLESFRNGYTVNFVSVGGTYCGRTICPDHGGPASIRMTGDPVYLSGQWARM